MARLIDADKLLIQLGHNRLKGDDEWELAVNNDIKTVCEAPTVMAIPVEWVNRYLDKITDEGKASVAVALEVMMNVWADEDCEPTNIFENVKLSVGELIKSGKYICGTTKLPCCFCSLYCEHRKEKAADGDSD